MNQISMSSTHLSYTITSLKLEHNELTSISSIKHLAGLPRLKQLSLRGNAIDSIYQANTADTPVRFSRTLTSVDLSCNMINSWAFVNELPSVFPGLQALRISGNPLYDKPVASSTVTNLPEKPMTVDEAYMLTLSRLSCLEVLNYSKITPNDRQNGELYYLSLIGKELSASSPTAEREVLASHPRYGELCRKYGEPVVKRAARQADAVNPQSVAARLVKMTFHLPSNEHDRQATGVVKIKEIPRSFDTYQLKAIVAQLFDLSPFQFRLIWETDELDPTKQENMGEDDYDSDEGGEDDAKGDFGTKSAETDVQFIRREVELVDSTRDIGVWFYGDLTEAKVRVDICKHA